MFDDKTSRPIVFNRGTHAGKPQPRVGKPPCRTILKCPKGTPEKRLDLNGRNGLAYLHYLECKAVGEFPDDPIVRRNARICAMAEEHERDRRQMEMVAIHPTAARR